MCPSKIQVTRWDLVYHMPMKVQRIQMHQAKWGVQKTRMPMNLQMVRRLRSSLNIHLLGQKDASLSVKDAARRQIVDFIVVNMD